MTTAPRPASTPGRTCSICHHVYPVCRKRWADDHDFVSITAARQAAQDATQRETAHKALAQLRAAIPR